MPKLCSRKTSLILFLLLFAAAGFGCACTSRKNLSLISTVPIQVESALRLNVNTASVGDLEKIPNIGPSLAKKIIEHRDRYGPFRKVEHLLLIDGISHRRFREIRNFITVE